MNINDIMFVAVMVTMLLAGAFCTLVILPRALKKEEEAVTRWEAKQWAAMKKIIDEKVRVGPMQFVKIEQGSRPECASVVWFDVSKRRSVEALKERFSIECEANYKAPTIEFVFDADALIREKFWGLWRVELTDETIKSLPFRDWLVPEMISKAIVRVSSVYEPFSLKAICSILFPEPQNPKNSGQNESDVKGGK